MTPKIILQTWKTKNFSKMRSDFKKYCNKWKLLHPNYKYFLFDDDDNLKFMEENFPQYLKRYNSFTQNIERVDFVRYALLYLYGGIYADMDMEPLKNFDDLVGRNKIILSYEPSEHSTSKKYNNNLLCNALMISPRKEQFWLDFMNFIVKENYKPYGNPVENTGPAALQKFFNKYPEKFQNVDFLDCCSFFSLTSEKEGGKISQECIGKDKEFYAQHKWANTWTSKNFLEEIPKRMWSSECVFWGFLIFFIILWIFLYYKAE